MSIAVADQGVGPVVVSRPARLRSVLALTRVECRRLIIHPAILAPSALIALMGARGPGGFRFLFLETGIGYFALGIGTLLAASLCVSRSRRDRTEELFGSLPLPPADRSVAHLLSVAAPLVAALLFAGVVAASTRPWARASVRLDIEPRTIMYGLPDFALGPLIVAFMGVAGVVLARWFITPIAIPVVFAGIFAVSSLTDLAPGALRWLNPAADYSNAGIGSASVMPWHLVYVTGLILLLALVALARRPSAPGLRVYGAVAVTATGIGGLMQILAASS